MDRWLTLFPKGLLAFLAIGGGIVFIILNNPPHTICEAQIDVFKSSEKHFLYPDDSKTKILHTTRYQFLMEHCRSTNDPGGCYELFHETRVLLKDLDTVPSQCLNAVASIPEVREALWGMSLLLVQLGWGEKPPTTYFEKFGKWLDRADISMFCWLHRTISAAFGEQAWKDWQDKTMTQLPGADTVLNSSSDLARARDDIRDMTIFSENCAQYP